MRPMLHLRCAVANQMSTKTTPRARTGFAASRANYSFRHSTSGNPPTDYPSNMKHNPMNPKGEPRMGRVVKLKKEEPKPEGLIGLYGHTYTQEEGRDVRQSNVSSRLSASSRAIATSCNISLGSTAAKPMW